MGNYNGYRGVANGSIQSSYFDQPARGVNGMIAYGAEESASYIDGLLVGGTTGVFAGAGVQGIYYTPTAYDLQTPPVKIDIPNATNLTIADFGGVVVFHETMQSDSDGRPGWNPGRVARVLRPIRTGGRIWIHVNENDTVDPSSSTVHWVIKGGSDLKYSGGEFTTAALAGNATVGYSVAITTALWRTPSAASGLAIIEFGL